MHAFLVVGTARALVVQATLALRAHVDAECGVIVAKGTKVMRFSSLWSRYIEMDFNGEDDEKFVALVNRMAAHCPGLLIVPADCDGTRLTNRVRERLTAGLVPTPNTATLNRFDDKWSFYQFCVEAGLNAPLSWLIDSKEGLDFQRVAASLGSPFVVKPLHEQGSKGVRVIRSEAACVRLVRDETYQHAPLIVQRFIRGSDLGLNLLAIDGTIRAAAVQRRLQPQDEVAPIQFIHNDYLLDCAHQIARASAYTGIMNIDARMDEATGTIYLLESNPRVWRSMAASVWCGLNFMAELIEPDKSAGSMRTITDGYADTFHHPFFRPRLFYHAFSDSSDRGRLARLMLRDPCTLGSSAMAQWRKHFARPPDMLEREANGQETPTAH
ncbi:ATP-grasp domain-containing protein [Oxalobacteraceae bacterium OM1]|nr:ATP-grasp domain-containing protein [Oxalobacteraceae bacterium OM1]